MGLKVYKGLGLTDTDSQGNRIAVNDPRMDPIWEECGRLGLPCANTFGRACLLLEAQGQVQRALVRA